MIYSMTGFGRQEGTVLGANVTVELRSVNNRFLETVIRTPRKWSSIEDPLRELLQKEFSRGKIDATVVINEEKKSLTRLRVNEGLLKEYEHIVDELKRRFPLQDSLTVGQILNLPDIYLFKEDPTDFKKMLAGVEKIAGTAVANLKKAQRKEGTTLAKDLRQRIKVIDRNLKEILRVVPKKRKEIRENLSGKVQQLLSDPNAVSKDRLEMEIVLIAEKADITEECVRLQSHLDYFLSVLREGGAVGKRLDFILQEMHRESNTIGAKAASFDISRNVVQMKEEIERLKEQVRNIV